VPRALLTGISGQDGAYLADLLLSKGYEVFGLKRRLSTTNLWRLESLGIEDKVTLIEGDMTDMSSLQNAVDKSEPDEIYNLAAQSFVPASFEAPILTFDINAKGVINLLEAVRLSRKEIKFYQASTSEMFGGMQPESQSEKTAFNPRSPYAVSKAAAHYATINYREAYGLHASCGILFNHESPLRGDEFVTKKITNAVRRMQHGYMDKLVLGNIDACRDWGHARDYVYAMWLMLQQESPDDYVIATGETHSVREFAKLAFEAIDLRYEDHVSFDEKFLRPSEVPVLRGDPQKAKDVLGWTASVTFQQLIDDMIFDEIKAQSKSAAA